jgi:hypothetical protein
MVFPSWYYIASTAFPAQRILSNIILEIYQCPSYLFHDRTWTSSKFSDLIYRNILVFPKLYA